MPPKHTDLPYALMGLRHLAIRVRDLKSARTFYEGLLGLKVVWEPDSQNVYLSSGNDNLALHEIPEADREAFISGPHQPLDHFGFLVETPEAVEGIFARMTDAGVHIVKPVKGHRDGSHSFYVADPDGNVIQILYEPHISPMRLIHKGNPGPPQVQNKI